jgi:hypothetical protein
MRVFRHGANMDKGRGTPGAKTSKRGPHGRRNITSGMSMDCTSIYRRNANENM